MPNTEPNAVSERNTDPLTVAQLRMRDATVNQLREALRMYRNGDDIGCYLIPLRPFLACAVEDRG